MTYADPMLEVKKNEYNIYSLLKKLVRNILYKRLIHLTHPGTFE